MDVRPKLILIVLAIASFAVLAAAVPAAATAPVTLTLAPTPAVLTSGQTVTLHGHIDVPGATVVLSRRYAGEAGFTAAATLVADDAGDVVWKSTPEVNATYRIEFAGDATHAAATAEAEVGVHPMVTLRVTARRPVIEGRRVTLSMAVSPGHAGGVVDVKTWTRKAGWTTLDQVTLDASSKATYVMKAGDGGLLTLRVKMEADAGHLAGNSAISKIRIIDPRNPYGVPERYPHLILVDLSKYRLYYHEHGHIVRVFDCVLGRPGLPTPKGHFKIYAKDPQMSGPYGPRRMRYLGLYAIHGTDEPWLLNRYPRNYSHGCTRLSNAHILWLYSRVHVGTPVWNVP